jgi:rod shape-determining protein MreD
MIYVLWAVIIILTVLLQGSISFIHIKLNLTVVLVCYVGMKRGEIPGMFFGALIGLIEDSLSGVLFGPNILSKGLIGYLSSSLYRKLFIWTPLIGAINIFSLTFLDSVLIFILRSIFDKIPIDISSALFIIMVRSLVNAPAGIFIKPKDVS